MNPLRKPSTFDLLSRPKNMSRAAAQTMADLGSLKLRPAKRDLRWLIEMGSFLLGESPRTLLIPCTVIRRNQARTVSRNLVVYESTQ